MAHLAGQVEEHVLTLDQGAHRIGIAHIGNVDAQPVFVPGNVKQIAAIVRDQRIDQRDMRAQIGQSPRQVGADEAQAAGDKDSFVGVEVEMSHRYNHGCAGLRGFLSG